MVIGSVDWTTVIVAAFTALPGTAAAYFAFRTRAAVRTPSGDPIGKVVERAHETAVANHLILRRMNGWTIVEEGEPDVETGNQDK